MDKIFLVTKKNYRGYGGNFKEDFREPIELSSQEVELLKDCLVVGSHSFSTYGESCCKNLLKKLELI